MELKARVLSVDESKRTMVIRYFSDTVTEVALAAENNPTDLTLDVPAPTPSTEALQALIFSSVPHAYFQRWDALNDPSINKDLADVTALVGQEQVVGTFFIRAPVTPTAVHEIHPLVLEE